MGGCVVSVMEVRNSLSLTDNKQFRERAVYGTVNEKITEDEADRSGIYRSGQLTDAQHKEYCNWFYGDNMLQKLQKQCVARADKNAIAYREIEKICKQPQTDSKGNVREWEHVYLKDPTYITYAELWKMVLAYGRGLAELGLRKDSKLALYEETRWEWLVSMLGSWTQEMVGVTVYANLGEDALLYALKESACEAVVCNGANVAKLINMMEEMGIHDMIVIYLDELPANVDLKGHKAVAWKEVLALGEKSSKPHTIITDNETLVLIMYTSGTTGNPKGVMHSIGGITQGAMGLNSKLIELLGLEEEETYVSYLPAAHIFEFICENIMLIRGTLLCFGTPRTLTDAFAHPAGDLTTFNPFFLIGVPRIFETIKKTVESRLPPPGTLKRRVFDQAYLSRLKALQSGKDTPYWTDKVFKVPRAIMGKRMRGICSGGAPLADKTQEWINVVLHQPVAQGYGMTETVCNAAVQRTGELKCEAGQLLRGVEARLLDTEAYKHTDKPHPRGELMLRGKFNFQGYYNQPEMTQECLVEGGWVRTGDVVEMDGATGQMRVVGRVKALAKNVLGEYIALESLEALYGQHPVIIPNGICVLVDSQKPYICALLLTDENKAMSFAKKEGMTDATWPAVLQDAAFNAAVVKSLAALGKSERKKPFELLKRVKILSDEWTPENNLVTASMKVRRSVIDEHYKEVIASLFDDGEE